MANKREPYSKLKEMFRQNRITENMIAQKLHININRLEEKINGSGEDFTLDEIRRIKAVCGLTADQINEIFY